MAGSNRPASALAVVTRFNDAFSWGRPGSKGSVRGVDLFKVRDGKVAEKLVY